MKLSKSIGINKLQLELNKLIDTLQTISSKPTIYLCIPPPVYPGTGSTNKGYKDSLSVIVGKVYKEVAPLQGVQLIDLRTPLLGHPELFFDGLHPNCQGHTQIGTIIYNQIANASGVSNKTGSCKTKNSSMSQVVVPGHVKQMSNGTLYGISGRKCVQGETQNAHVYIWNSR